MRDIYLSRLADLREKNHTSLALLESKLGISQSTLSRWLQGKGSPSVDDLERLIEALGGNIRDIFADVGEQELRAAEKIDYKGIDTLLADFERREKITKEHYDARIAHEVQLRTQLQSSFDAAIQALSAAHDAALKKLDELSATIDRIQHDQHVADLRAHADRQQEIIRGLIEKR